MDTLSDLQHAALDITILVVDDNVDNLRLLSQIIESEGYQVRKARSGTMALQGIERHLPDLILLDITMPDMNGYEVCQNIKANEKTAHIPIIFISALDNIQDKLKAFNFGGVDYISKPFHDQEVKVRIRNQLELIAAQQTLRRKNDELELLNKDLETFNSMVAHDLRRQLTKILGFSDLLLTENNLPQEKQKILKIILNTSQEMDQIITDLMRLAQVRQHEIQNSPVNLSAIAAEIGTTLQSQNPAHPVELFIQPDLMFFGDAKLLKLALENLLENAWKYSRNNPKAKVDFFLTDEGNFCIRDNGVGFDMAHHTEVFTPFQRFHNAEDFEGTGIGLSIVQRIIHSHQGKIWCESVPQEGTSFFFWLPTPVSPMSL